QGLQAQRLTTARRPATPCRAAVTDAGLRLATGRRRSSSPPGTASLTRCRRASFRRRPDPQPVAVRVAQLNLTRPRSVLHLHTELGGHGLDIPNAEIDQCTRTGITVVLRQEQPHPAPGDLDECRKPRLEAVFPLLGEAQPLIPRDRRRSVLDVKNGNDFFVHAVIVA